MSQPNEIQSTQKNQELLLLGEHKNKLFFWTTDVFLNVIIVFTFDLKGLECVHFVPFYLSSSGLLWIFRVVLCVFAVVLHQFSFSVFGPVRCYYIIALPSSQIKQHSFLCNYFVDFNLSF